MKKKTLALSLALAFGAMGGAQASIVTIDPDGADPGANDINVAVLAWTPGNAIAVADNGQSFGAGQTFVGQTFTTFAHARLGTFNNIMGDPIATPPMGTEWTFVLGYQQEITNVVGNTIEFAPTGAGDINFFQIYFDDPANSSNLAGRGFNDGTLILDGTITQQGSGAFTNTNPACVADPDACEPLDQFGTNNYPDVNSISGEGSASLVVDVTSVDPNFFKTAFDQLVLNFTSQQRLEFEQQNPSSCFWNGTAFIGGAGPGIGIANPCANAVGAINGVSGPDVMFQTDASNNFVVRVPEPGSLALMGLGLAGLGFGFTRRRRQSMSA